MENQLIYLEKANIYKHIFGYVLVFIGFALIVQFLFLYSILIIGIGIKLIFRTGIEFNLDNKKYRTLISLFGIEFGFWKNLPTIDYISVFKTTENKKYGGFTASTVSHNEIIKLIFFYQTNKKIEIYKTENIDDALKKAKFIAELLNLKIYDATTTNDQKWL
jgi:hypothetical protein